MIYSSPVLLVYVFVSRGREVVKTSRFVLRDVRCLDDKDVRGLVKSFLFFYGVRCLVDKVVRWLVDSIRLSLSG